MPSSESAGNRKIESEEKERIIKERDRRKVPGGRHEFRR